VAAIEALPETDDPWTTGSANPSLPASPDHSAIRGGDERSNSMRLSNLSSWWNERLQARDARRATDAERSEELLALLDEASSIRRRRS
jgi:hypothetical protein